MLGYIPESISFKVAATVAWKVLASLHSQSLCHKVISASRLKGDSKESSWNVENRSKDVLHVSFDASSIEGTANRHCTAVFLVTTAKSSFQLVDQMVNQGNRKISPIVVFYRFSRVVCTVALNLRGFWFLHCDVQLLGNLACSLKPFCMILLYLLVHRRVRFNYIFYVAKNAQYVTGCALLLNC